MSSLIAYDSDGGLPWFLWIYIVAWLGFIAAVLSRRDLEPAERLIWLITVIFVPLFGIFFYLFLAPENPNKKAIELPDDDFLAPLNPKKKGVQLLDDDSPPAGSEKKTNLQSDVAGNPMAK